MSVIFGSSLACPVGGTSLPAEVFSAWQPGEGPPSAFQGLPMLVLSFIWGETGLEQVTLRATVLCLGQPVCWVVQVS